jgi:hypothetical protein
MRRPVCSVAPLPGSGLAWDKGEWYSPLSSAMDDSLSPQFRLVTDACLTVEPFRGEPGVWWRFGSVRFGELDQLQRAAEVAHLPVSTLIRVAALGHVIRNPEDAREAVSQRLDRLESAVFDRSD